MANTFAINSSASISFQFEYNWVLMKIITPIYLNMNVGLLHSWSLTHIFSRLRIHGRREREEMRVLVMFIPGTRLRTDFTTSVTAVDDLTIM